MTSIDTLIDRQLRRWEIASKGGSEESISQPSPLPIVTISRQSGSRGSYFASRLAQKMDYQRLHREVIDAICRSSGYVKRIVESLDDHFRGNLDLMIEAMLTGQSVDHGDYIRHLAKVILSMSRLGGVVLVGRGGNFILGPNRGFHIRFVAPREKRIENLVKYKEMDEAEAASTIDRTDHDRKQFISKLFEADIDDPVYYDMSINSSLMDVEDLVDVVHRAVKAKFDKLRFIDHDQI